MNLKAELKHKKSLKLDAAKAIQALATDEVELTESQETEFDTIMKDVEALDKRLRRQEQLEAAEAKRASSRKDDSDNDRDDDDEDKAADDEDDDDKDDDKDDNKKSMKTSGPLITYGVNRGEHKSQRALRFIVGAGVAKTSGRREAARWAEFTMGDKTVSKALHTLQNFSGGALIPQDFVQDLVPLLYSETVIRGGGAPVYPMPLRNMTIPRQVAGGNAYWIGELDPIPLTDQKFGDLHLWAKKLGAMTAVTMDLIRGSPLSVEQLVLNDLREQMVLKEELAELLSPGTDAAVPPGLLSLAGTTTVAAALPTATGTNQAAILFAIQQVLQGQVLNFRSQNISTAGAKWIIPESVYTFLQTVPDGFGRPYFFQAGQENSLFGIPVLRTNLIPTNLSVTRSGTTTTDNTYIFLVNYPDLIIADTLTMLTDSSTIASYETGGAIRSSYQEDKMVFRTIKEFDFNVRRPQSISVLQVTGFAPSGWTGNAGLVYVGAPATSGTSPAGSTQNVTSSPTVAANTAAVVSANDTADGAPGGTITPNSGGDAYEGA